MGGSQSKIVSNRGAAARNSTAPTKPRTNESTSAVVTKKAGGTTKTTTTTKPGSNGGGIQNRTNSDNRGTGTGAGKGTGTGTQANLADCVFAPILDHINYYRAAHGARALTLSESLSAQAQANADDIVKLSCGASGPVLQHNNPQGQGQNLYIFYADDNSKMSANDFGYGLATRAVDSWYSESQYVKDSRGNTVHAPYRYDMEPIMSSGDCGPDQMCFTQRGHFTQLIWDDTTEVGFGVATKVCNGMTWILVVANFIGPQIRGTFRSHVHPLVKV